MLLALLLSHAPSASAQEPRQTDASSLEELQPPADGAVSEAVDLGTVDVEGAQLSGGSGSSVGANGSSDPDATEGTKAYATGRAAVASKMPLTIRETPQTVTVISQERIQDQNLTSIEDVLKQTPGITVQPGPDSMTPVIFSRGFQIDTFQIDGGAPITFGSRDDGLTRSDGVVQGVLVPNLDMSIYDRVEVLRGSAGRFGAMGDPGGIISLTRKRPTAGTQVQMEGTLGTFDADSIDKQRRLSADVSTPLFGGEFARVRVVGTIDDDGYSYDTAFDRQRLIYGNLEVQPFESTQINIGASYNRRKALPWNGGLPLYADMTDIGLPRTFCLCTDWSRLELDSMEYFAQLRQQLAPDWTLSINASAVSQTSKALLGNVSSVEGILPDGTGLQVGASRAAFEADNRSVDANVSGAFDILGHRQEIVFGGNYSVSTFARTDEGFFAMPGVDVSIFDFDPSTVAPPLEEDYTPTFGTKDPDESASYAGFVNMRFSLWDPLHFLIGETFNGYDLAARAASEATSDLTFQPPNLGVTYDIFPQTTVYASRDAIYSSNANSFDRDGATILPTTGATYEVGVKRSDFNDTLMTSLSLYYTRQRNMMIDDPTVLADDPRRIDGRCCWLNSDNLNVSQGFDVEVAGFATPELQIQAGYTFNDNTKGLAPTLDELGELRPGTKDLLVNTSLQPAHSFKAAVRYEPMGGFLENAVFGISAIAQSKSLVEETRYTGENLDQPTTLSFSQEPYVTFDAFAKYKFNERLEGQLNVNNLFDKAYYAAVGGVRDGNSYGDRRSVMLSLRAKF